MEKEGKKGGRMEGNTERKEERKKHIKIKMSIIYLTYINKNRKDKNKDIFGNCIDFMVVFQIVLGIICLFFCSLLSIADFFFG